MVEAEKEIAHDNLPPPKFTEALQEIEKIVN